MRTISFASETTENFLSYEVNGMFFSKVYLQFKTLTKILMALRHFALLKVGAESQE